MDRSWSIWLLVLMEYGLFSAGRLVMCSPDADFKCGPVDCAIIECHRLDEEASCGLDDNVTSRVDDNLWRCKSS